MKATKARPGPFPAETGARWQHSAKRGPTATPAATYVAAGFVTGTGCPEFLCRPTRTDTGISEGGTRIRWTVSKATGYTETSQNPNTTMIFREPLPDDCPPDDAQEITSPHLVYRLVRNIPPINDDFRSQRAEKPTAQFNVSECRARGVSVFTNLGDAERQTRRRNLRNLIPCLVTLTAGAGRIEKTGGSSHYTWWPYDSYDILANCQLVKP